MAPDKDIRYVEKKVDESWKDRVESDRLKLQPEPAVSSARQDATSRSHSPKPSPAFMSLLNSLVYQAMYHMGELQTPEAPAPVNLDAVREVIELLSALREKTKGNLAPDEVSFFDSALSELQSKYVQLAS